MKSSTGVKRPSRYPCIFKGRFVREQVDPRVKSLWEQTTGKPAPFGRLRMNFQREHCRAINPYGSESCPYREEECAMAFLGAVQNSLLPWITDPAAYFVQVARSTGIERADNKPLAREHHREERPGDPGDVQGGHGSRRSGDLAGVRPADAVRDVREQEDDLRRSHARPLAIGDLLGSINLGPRQGPSDDGKESAQ